MPTEMPQHNGSQPLEVHPVTPDITDMGVLDIPGIDQPLDPAYPRELPVEQDDTAHTSPRRFSTWRYGGWSLGPGGIEDGRLQRAHERSGDF